MSEYGSGRSGGLALVSHQAAEKCLCCLVAILDVKVNEVTWACRLVRHHDELAPPHISGTTAGIAVGRFLALSELIDRIANRETDEGGVFDEHHFGDEVLTGLERLTRIIGNVNSVYEENKGMADSGPHVEWVKRTTDCLLASGAVTYSLSRMSDPKYALMSDSYLFVAGDSIQSARMHFGCATASDLWKVETAKDSELFTSVCDSHDSESRTSGK